MPLDVRKFKCVNPDALAGPCLQHFHGPEPADQKADQETECSAGQRDNQGGADTQHEAGSVPVQNVTDIGKERVIH